jgi:hypothetical protein
MSPRVNPSGDDGLNPLDIADLPEDQQRIILTLLRDADASEDGSTLDYIQEKLGDMDNLLDVLDELTESNWLITQGDPPDIYYRVNFRRKRKGTLRSNLWSALDNLGDDKS